MTPALYELNATVFKDGDEYAYSVIVTVNGEERPIAWGTADTPENAQAALEAEVLALFT
jgi:hypothetical protein